MGKPTVDSQELKSSRVEELKSLKERERRMDNAEAQRALSYAEKRNPSAPLRASGNGCATSPAESGAEFNGGVT
jgi:hypothetical protein